MFKDALRNVEGLEIYPTISFVIFFLFFLGLMIYVYGLTKNHIHEMGQMPLEETTLDTEKYKNEKNK